MSYDMPANSVQFCSMHIRIRFGLNAHSIRFAEDHVICEMLQCAFKTELGRNVKRPLENFAYFVCVFVRVCVCAFTYVFVRKYVPGCA